MKFYWDLLDCPSTREYNGWNFMDSIDSFQKPFEKQIGRSIRFTVLNTINEQLNE